MIHKRHDSELVTAPRLLKLQQTTTKPRVIWTCRKQALGEVINIVSKLIFHRIMQSCPKFVNIKRLIFRVHIGAEYQLYTD